MLKVRGEDVIGISYYEDRVCERAAEELGVGVKELTRGKFSICRMSQWRERVGVSWPCCNKPSPSMIRRSRGLRSSKLANPSLRRPLVAALFNLRLTRLRPNDPARRSHGGVDLRPDLCRIQGVVGGSKRVAAATNGFFCRADAALTSRDFARRGSGCRNWKIGLPAVSNRRGRVSRKTDRSGLAPKPRKPSRSSKSIRGRPPS